MNGSEDSLELFLRGFAARDLAEPLLSFDNTMSVAEVGSLIRIRTLEAVGIRNSGAVVSWLARSDALSDAEQAVHPIDLAAVISDRSPLHEVVDGLRTHSHLFVRSYGQINGYICRNELQKPAMRMWLFGLVTIIEMRVPRMIDELCPQDSWKRYLSERRLQMALELQSQRRQRQQHPKLLECLHLADKGQIVSKDNVLRQHTRFSSRRAVQSFVNSLQDLRNNLAHANDISGDWEIIVDLAANLHRTVLGPATIDDPVSDVGNDSTGATPPQSPGTHHETH